jgi:hypothetical protein
VVELYSYGELLMILWKKWKTIKKGDYLYAKIPEHPNATKNGYVLEHRVVLENKLGRLLERHEEAHHIDENRHNNHPDNIELKLTGEHQRFHKLKYPEGHFVKEICTNCGVEYNREYSNRKEIKNYKLNFCSRKCNGQYYKDITNNLKNKKDNNHGINMYRNGCRCDTCKKASRDKQREYRERKK